ncbi:MAG: HAMP domain-containing histidine kinase [Thermoleophilia bacterium]|nr:HAMP domain-containing histidine kinase [Thermoleophilia bacterium]
MSGLGERLLWRSDSVGVALLDDAARVVRASATFERIVRRRGVGASAADLVVVPQRDALLRLVHDAGADWATLRVAVGRDPEEAPTDVRAWVARASEGILLVLEPVGSDLATLNAELLALNDELTAMERELRRRGRELADRNERLLELDRLKAEFLSLVSHEFRTPLASMRGYVELLADEVDGLTPKQRRFVEVLGRNVARLLRLVDDLLFVAQADAGRVELELVPLDLSRLVDEAAEAARPLAAEKDVELRTRGEPVLVEGDHGRLLQLVDNLVVNAVKFTPAGGTVDVGVAAGEGRGILTVRDTGIGIPPEDQERVFERFFRSRGAASRALPGTGLGLTVVKTIADAHGAELSVESADGQGTVFRVVLPAQPAGGR